MKQMAKRYFIVFVALFSASVIICAVWSLSRAKPIEPVAEVSRDEAYCGDISNRMKRVVQTAVGQGRQVPAENTEQMLTGTQGRDLSGSSYQADAENREEEDERLVDAFDNLTDQWMEGTGKKNVTMEDVRLFNEQFRKIPKARREECLQRALNLIPDENVMLLAGILMDKSYDLETLELVFNDILNRDEDVKKPILQEIFKDKAHPCWADTAWILDVTGEHPDKK